MVSANKPLLIIKTGNTVPGLRDQGEDFEDWFAAGCGLSTQQYRVVSLFLGEPLPEIEEVSALLVTGSPAYVTDLEPWNFAGASYLRHAHQRLPILGVCYGHQLLAWAFDGEVDFNPAGRQFGLGEASLTAAAARDPLFRDLPDPVPVQLSHQQVVTRLPDAAELLASRDADPNHAFRLGQFSWGVQFHPEFSVRISACYMEERRQALTEEGFDVDAKLAALRRTPGAEALLRRFAVLAGF